MEIVKVRVFIGALLKKEDGSYKTENHTVKIPKPSKEWNLFLEHAKKMYSKVELIEVTKENIEFGKKMVKGKEVPTQNHTYKVVDSSEDIKNAIADIYANKAELTDDQKKIAELEAKLNAVLEQNSEKPKKPTKQKKDIDPKLEELRAKYTELYKKKPNHLMKVESLEKAINEFKPAE